MRKLYLTWMERGQHEYADTRRTKTESKKDVIPNTREARVRNLLSHPRHDRSRLPRRLDLEKSRSFRKALLREKASL
jgi:hypothetical protein